MARGRGTLTERRAKKLRCFEMLADDVPVSEVARAVGVNKGTVSRWRRGGEFAEWITARLTQAGDVLPFPQDNRQGDTLADPGPETRARFLAALKACGRIDVAATYSQAHPQAVAQWLVAGDADITAAQAEAYLRGVQVITNIMQAKGADGQPIEVRPADQLRAAGDFIRLTDFGRQVATPTISVDINAARAAVIATQDATPMSVLTDELRRQLARAEQINLMADVDKAAQ